MPDDAPTRIEYHSHPDKDGICIFTLFYPDESAEDGEFVEVKLDNVRRYVLDEDGMTKCIDGDYVDAEDVDALVEKIMKEVCE